MFELKKIAEFSVGRWISDMCFSRDGSEVVCFHRDFEESDYRFHPINGACTRWSAITGQLTSEYASNKSECMVHEESSILIRDPVLSELERKLGGIEKGNENQYTMLRSPDKRFTALLYDYYQRDITLIDTVKKRMVFLEGHDKLITGRSQDPNMVSSCSFDSTSSFLISCGEEAEDIMLWSLLPEPQVVYHERAGKAFNYIFPKKKFHGDFAVFSCIGGRFLTRHSKKSYLSNERESLHTVCIYEIQR